MAKFLNNVDLNANELRNAVIQNLGTAPSGAGSNAKAGGIYFDTAGGANVLKYHNGSSWIQITSGTPGSYQPIDADLTAIAALSTTGYLKRTGADTWALDTDVALTTGKLSQFAATSSSELAGVISDETGSGALVFGTSPAITTSLTTGSTSFDLLNTTATTINFGGAATNLNMGSAGGTVTIAGNLTVNGTTTTVNSTTVTVDDKNLELGSTATPTDAGADGGGITLKGTTDKSIVWYNATDSWTFDQHIDLTSGNVIKFNGTQALSATDYTGNSATATTAVNVAGGGAGYLVYNTGASVTASLALGTAGYVLTAGASAPQWTKKKHTATIGNNSATTIAVTHSLGTQDVVVAVYTAADNTVVYPDITYTDSNTVTLDFAVAPTSNQYKVVVLS